MLAAVRHSRAKHSVARCPRYRPCGASSVASLQSRRSSLDSLPSDPAPLNRISGGLSSGAAGRLGAVQGDGIAGIDSLDMAVMGRGLSHALGDQPMSMSIDDIGFSERG